MKHIIQFSGGAGSWAAAKLVAAQHGTEDMVLLFADTRMEDHDLYRFLVEASSDSLALFCAVMLGIVIGYLLGHYVG